MTNAQSKIILLIIAVSRQTTLDRYWGKDFAPDAGNPIEIKTKKYNTNEYIELQHERQAYSTYLFKANKKNDEYYTRAHTWQRFIDDKGYEQGEDVDLDDSFKEAASVLAHKIQILDDYLKIGGFLPKAWSLSQVRSVKEPDVGLGKENA